MKSNSSFLIVKKLIQVLFLRVYTNISAVKAVSIHSCFSTCGRISFFFPGDIIWVWFSSFKNDKVEHVLLYYFLNDIFWSFIKRQASDISSDTSSDEWQTTSDNEWQRVTKSDKEWQRMAMSYSEWDQWYSEWKRHSTLQRMDDCHHFNDKKRYTTTSRDGWLQLEWLNK